jgi:hypothetical protein
MRSLTEDLTASSPVGGNSKRGTSTPFMLGFWFEFSDEVLILIGWNILVLTR